MHKNYNNSSSQLDSSDIQQSIRLAHRNSLESNNFQNYNCLVCQQMTIKTYQQSFYTCGHRELCSDCMRQYSKNCLYQNSIPKCLLPDCQGTLKHQNELIMGQFSVRIAKDIKKAIKQNKMKDNKKCTMADCRGFIKNGTCNMCLTIFCENCYNKQHLGACISSVILPQQTKQCPQCKQGIQQDGGCLHMKCPRCKYNFCFKCLEAWSQSHHACEGGKSFFTALIGWFTD